MTASIKRAMQVPFSVTMLRVASALMLFLPVLVDVLVLIAWLTLGITENSWSVVNILIMLAALILTFLQYFLSSFLFGMAASVVSPPAKPEDRYSRLVDRLSDTIDLGWGTTFRVGIGCTVVALLAVAITFCVYCNDVIFVIGFFRGNQLVTEKHFDQSVRWYQQCVRTAGPDRSPIARYWLAGAYVRTGNYTAAIDQLHLAIEEVKKQPVPSPTLLVFLNFILCDAQQRMLAWSDAEKTAEATLHLVRTTKVFPEVPVHLIADVKEYLDPDMPTTLSALHLLERVYLKQQKLDKAEENYKQIMAEYTRDNSTTQEQLFREMHYFQREAGNSQEANNFFADKIVEDTFQHAQLVVPKETTDRRQFFANFERSELNSLKGTTKPAERQNQ